VPRLRLGLNVLHLIEIRDQPLRDGRTPPPRLFPYPISFRSGIRSGYLTPKFLVPPGC
jgi:hypothetical protein